MATRIQLRALAAEERAAAEALARSRTAPFRQVQRARLIASMADDPALSASAAARRVGLETNMGPTWVRRFNTEGLVGLKDRPRSGRPPVHSEAVKGEVLALARQKPDTLGLPFALWTLDRLRTHLLETKGIDVAPSTIWKWVEAEGLHWKRQESWFHDAEKTDPDFAEKRGPSSQPTFTLLNGRV